MSYGLGIIGAGSIGRCHAETAASLGVRIVGVCDDRPARAQAMAEPHAGAIATSSIDELLAVPGLQAVLVAVPNHLHASYTIQALRAGKDVLLEKPMGMNAAECDEIIATLNGTDRIVQLGFVTRYAPAVIAAKRMIDAGRFGRIYHVRGQWLRRRGIPGLGGWFTDRARSGGGVLIDLGVHMIDVMMHLAGRPEPQRASGVCTSRFGTPIGTYVFDDMWAGPPRADGTFSVEDGAAAMIRCAGDVTMQLDVSWAANVPQDAEAGSVVVLGDAGGCTLQAWSNSLVVATEQDGTLIDVRPQLPAGEPWDRAFRMEHEVFAAAVTDRVAPAACAADGRQVQSILDAIYRSAEAGEEVAVSG